MKKRIWGLLLAAFIPALYPTHANAATITGTIVKQGTDTLLADASVILRRGATPVDTLVTAADGAFSFTSVDSANYSLAITKAGYQNGQRNVNVTKADTTITVQIGLTAIPAPGKLSGTVTNASDAPVVNATVVVTRRTGGNFTDTLKTDSTGHFGMDSLTAGTGYSISVIASTYLRKDSTNVTIPAGATATVAFKLAVIPPADATLGGTVTDSSATALAGVKVYLRLRATNVGTTTTIDSVETGVDGKFLFDSLEASAVAGTYSLRATKTTYNTYNSANITLAGSQHNDTLKIIMALTPPPAAPGKISGIVTDTAATPVANAVVVVSRRTGGFFNDTVKTGTDGKFFFDSLTAGAGYTVSVSGTAFMNKDTANVTVPAGDTAKLTVILKKEPAPTAEILGVASGDSTQKQLAGVKVYLRVRTTNAAPWVILDSAVTGADGKYDFKALRASAAVGTYSLLGTKAGFNNGTSANITLNAAQVDTVNLTLVPINYGSLIVIVTSDSAGTTPIKAADILVRANSGSTANGVTNDNGVYTADSLVVGNYTVTASVTGYVAKSGTRAVTKDGKDTLKIVLVAATEQNSKSVSGVVSDSTGKAVAGATVTLATQGAGAIRLVVETDASGKYAFTGIPATATNATLTVTKSGFATVNSNVALTGATATQNVTLRPGLSAIQHFLRARNAKVKTYQPGAYLLPSGARVRLNGSMLNPIAR